MAEPEIENGEAVLRLTENEVWHLLRVLGWARREIPVLSAPLLLLQAKLRAFSPWPG
jgi:hypothetical protein